MEDLEACMLHEEGVVIAYFLPLEERRHGSVASHVFSIFGLRRRRPSLFAHMAAATPEAMPDLALPLVRSRST